jgi:tRNA (guanine-N7-)-methyltransferase
MLPNESLSGMHVYFPDPWWKARHRKRRILNPEFLQHAGRIMQSGSQLHIWTDVEEYFNEAVLVVNDTLLFGKASKEPAGGLENKYRTHFERRTRLAGDPVWRAVFTRNEKPSQQNRLVTKIPNHSVASPNAPEIL